MLLAHALALVAVWTAMSGLPGWALATAVLISLAAALRHALLLAERSALALELHEDGRGSWQDRKGAWHQGILGPNRFVSTWLVILELGSEGSRVKRVALLGDSASPEDFRRLRVWLRWKPPAAGRSQ